MGFIVIRRGRGDGAQSTSRFFKDAGEAERAAATWRSEDHEVQVIRTDGRRRSRLIETVRRWLGPLAGGDERPGEKSS